MIEHGDNFANTGITCMKSTGNSVEMIDVETTSCSSTSVNGETLRISPGKKKTPSESSHKVIEKRRRDRINKCLAELGHIVPKAQLHHMHGDESSSVSTSSSASSQPSMYPWASLQSSPPLSPSSLSSSSSLLPLSSSSSSSSSSSPPSSSPSSPPSSPTSSSPSSTPSSSLSWSVSSSLFSQGTGKLEKAEVLELTVEYIKKLQSTNTNSTNTNGTMSRTNNDSQAPNVDKDEPRSCTKRELQSYTKGYSDCTNEVLHFMVTVEATDPQLPCFQRLMAHLRNNCRLLIDFENGKKEYQKSSTVTSAKLHGHNKRNHSVVDGQSAGGPKNKRSRDKAPDNSLDSTNGNGNDEPNRPPSTSGMTLDDKMKAVFKNGNNDGTNSPYNGNVNRNIKSENGNGQPPYQPNLLPFGNQGYPSPYPGLPAYAFLTAGTHYVPVPVHPGVQMPGNSLGGPMFPVPFITPGLGYFGSNLPNMSMGGLPTPLGGFVPPYMHMGGIGGITSLKGPEGLPAYLAQDKKSKERTRAAAQDSSGSSENDSSGDEYNFSTTSSSNLSEVGIQTDHPIDHSDYFSAGSR